MADEFDWRKFQFIIEVQTALINNAINRSLDEDAIEKRAQFSATGTLINMDDAFYAADRIPENMSAHEAANEFVHFVIGPENAEVPEWFARG